VDAKVGHRLVRRPPCRPIAYADCALLRQTRIPRDAIVAEPQTEAITRDEPREHLGRVSPTACGRSAPRKTGARSRDPEGEPLTYVWDFGDGSPPANGATPLHEYNVWGTYTVTLMVTDPVGLSATQSTTAVIAPPGHLRKPSP